MRATHRAAEARLAPPATPVPSLAPSARITDLRSRGRSSYMRGIAAPAFPRSIPAEARARGALSRRLSLSLTSRVSLRFCSPRQTRRRSPGDQAGRPPTTVEGGDIVDRRAAPIFSFSFPRSLSLSLSPSPLSSRSRRLSCDCFILVRSTRPEDRRPRATLGARPDTLSATEPAARGTPEIVKRRGRVHELGGGPWLNRGASVTPHRDDFPRSRTREWLKSKSVNEQGRVGARMCGDGVAGRRRILSVPRLGSSAPLSRARACVPSLSLSLPRPSRRLSLPAPYRSGITNRPDDVRPETTAAYDARQFRSIAASALSAGSIGSFARARFPLPFPPAGHAGAPEPGRAGPAERILSRNRKKYSANTAGERGGGEKKRNSTHVSALASDSPFVYTAEACARALGASRIVRRGYALGVKGSWNFS